MKAKPKVKGPWKVLVATDEWVTIRDADRKDVTYLSELSKNFGPNLRLIVNAPELADLLKEALTATEILSENNAYCFLHPKARDLDERIRAALKALKKP